MSESLQPRPRPDHDDHTSAAGEAGDTAACEDTRQSPGAMLHDARLAKGFSVADLCAHTKLTPQSVAALENNDFLALSQPVFARGYYRQCAKALDMDTDALMAAYTQWAGETTPRAAQHSRVNVQPQDVTPRQWRRLAMVALIVFAGLAIAGIFMLTPGGSSPKQDRVADNGATGAAGRDTGRAQAKRRGGGVARAASRGDAGGNRGSGGAGGGSATGSVKAPAGAGAALRNRPAGGRHVNESFAFDSRRDNKPAAGSASDDARKPPVDPEHLKLTFDKRSWISVRDASGKRLARGIYEKGETREFDGQPPYKLVLGFAPGVEVRIGGKRFDVKSHTRSDTTARFRVSAADNR